MPGSLVEGEGQGLAFRGDTALLFLFFTFIETALLQDFEVTALMVNFDWDMESQCLSRIFQIRLH